ncbi:hypothetical protein ACLMJK_002737 [Lecanora helva]
MDPPEPKISRVTGQRRKSAALDFCRPWVREDNASPRVLYYFFKDTSIEQRSASRAISTILHQLFVSHPCLIGYALEKYDERGAALATSLKELWSIFIAAATDPTAGSIICVLDALDECDEQEQSSLTQYLEDFCLCQQTSSSASRVKFLITSRPYFRIRQGFDNILEASNNIELAGNDESASIKKEIDLVIKHQVIKLKREIRLDQKVSDHLEKRLLETEHRTYLWLHLLWNIVRKNLSGTKAEMDRLIDKLPDDIEGSYEVLLQKCPDPFFARKVLQIVLVAARPLSLTEIDVALNVNKQTLSYADLEKEGPSRLQETLPSRCGLMVSIIQSKIYFIHQTVKDFLLGRASDRRPVGRIWQQSLDLIESHRLMTAVCLRVISFPEIHLSKANIWNALLPEGFRAMKANEYCSNFMFLSYSTVYWIDHFRGQESNEGFKTIKWCLKKCSHSSVLGDLRVRFGSILEAASFGGHDDLVQLALKEGVEVNTQGGEFGDALEMASVKGHKTVVQMLLDKGANVNRQGGHFGNALLAASYGGAEAVVQILIHKGADVNAQADGYGNALQAASYGGHETVVQILLDKGANVNAQGGGFGNALQAASNGGYRTVVQMLLDEGANVNAQGGMLSNALNAASDSGYKTIVRILLEHGANVNAQGGEYGNALQTASSGGYKRTVQILLDYGADINTQGGLLSNALYAASDRGHKTVVRKLLNRSANVNAQGGEYGNALQVASVRGHKQVVQMLLDKGADLNAQGGKYSTALQAALVNGHEDVAQVLRERGATR